MEFFTYIRMSTDAQAAKGTSTERQRQLAQAYAKKIGAIYKSENEILDLGVSGYTRANIKKGALGKFIDKYHSGEIPNDCFLAVENLDRLSRDLPLDVALMIRDLTLKGMTIVTLDNEREYGDDYAYEISGLIEQLFISSRAHEESKRKSENVAKGWDIAKRKAAQYKTPLTKHCPKWMKVTETDTGKVFELIPERVKIVQDIYQWCINGLGHHLICQKLNNRNEETWANGMEWHISTVAKILSNRSVLGEYKSGKRKGPVHIDDSEIGVITDYYPQIIAEDTFYQAQVAKSERNKAGGRKGKTNRNLLSGLTFCSNCATPLTKSESRKLEQELNSQEWFIKLSEEEQAEEFSNLAHKPTPMIFKDKGENSGIYYYCSKAMRGLDCTTRGYPVKEAEATILSHVKNFNFDELIESESGELLDEITALEKEIRAKTGKYDELSRKSEIAKERYFSAAQEGHEDLSKLMEESWLTFNKSKKALGQELKSAKDEKARLAKKLDSQKDTIKDARKLIAKMEKLTAAGKDDELKELRVSVSSKLRQLIRRVMLNSKVDQISTTVRAKNNKQLTIIYNDGSKQTMRPVAGSPEKLEYIKC